MSQNHSISHVFLQFCIPSYATIGLTTSNIVVVFPGKSRGESIAFGTFKRDAMLFKTVSLLQLVWLYVKHLPLSAHDLPEILNGDVSSLHQLDWVSLAMVFCGYGLATAAAAALGIDKTYFGWEMGQCKGGRVTSFPYNLPIPHPMIVGACVGLLGFHKLEGFRREAPLLVPAHVALYVGHMVQVGVEHTRCFFKSFHRTSFESFTELKYDATIKKQINMLECTKSKRLFIFHP